METIKFLEYLILPASPFSACENMQAIKLLLQEEMPERQLLSDSRSSECSSLQDVWGHFPLFNSQISSLSPLNPER